MTSAKRLRRLSLHHTFFLVPVTSFWSAEMPAYLDESRLYPPSERMNPCKFGDEIKTYWHNATVWRALDNQWNS
jgi:hypothetical protein